MPNELAIIIVSYNTRQLVAQCIDAVIGKQLPASWQIIVVDNASSDGSVEMLREQYPDVTLIANPENVGFGRANNCALETTNAEHVLFLNSDTIASQTALQQLVELMRADTQLGATSPMLRTPDGSAQAYAFGDEPTPRYLVRRALNRLVFKRPLHNWEMQTRFMVDWVSGACMLVRGDLARQLNGFDTRYFMYFEDTDLCKRVRDTGYRVAYIGDISITHIGGQSLKKNPSARFAYQSSLRLFYQTHYGRISNIVLRMLLPLYTRVSG
jgi:N-acetylglucosaminyl-diphospho-decaprenol L-rhamnosyltransferase